MTDDIVDWGLKKSEDKHVVLFFPRVDRIGGTMSVLAWAIEGISQNYEVTVCTLGRLYVDELNQVFGTAIDAERVRLVDLYSYAPCWRAICEWANSTTLEHYVVMHLAPRFLDEGALPISLHNEMKFPWPGIQYLHLPYLTIGDSSRAARLGLYSGWRKELYGRLCRWMFRVTNDDLSRNKTLCNSQWIADEFKEAYGGSVDVLFPPVEVLGVPNLQEWRRREKGIVLISRIVPHKRVHEALRIVKTLRDRGADLHIHIVYAGADQVYLRSLRESDEFPDWVFWEYSLSREAVRELMLQHRYGLHCAKNEHFGIATAELLSAGCLTFAHASGGSSEIIQNDRLLFRNVDEAIEKIQDVLSDPGAEPELLTHLRVRSQDFGNDRFVHGLCDAVETAFDQSRLTKNGRLHATD